jgi:hypothetical protein
MTDSSKTLVITRMDGPEDRTSEELENPTWQDIETAIRRLDGDRCSLLILGIGDPVPHMGIGGGHEGKYIVYATPDHQIFHNLINPNAAPGKSFLVAGGQLGDYANRQCIDLTVTLRAAKTYAESGQLDTSLIWERQG